MAGQLHSIDWPLSPDVVKDIDDNFRSLFHLVFDLERDLGPDGVLAPPLGGTGMSEYVIGDLLVATDTDELGVITAVAKGQVFISQGVGVVPAYLAAGTSGYVLTSGGAGVDPSWAQVTHTLLDGTLHTDTLVGTVVRGDIIIGNLTPKWSRLAIGAGATFVRSNGTDVSWSTVADSDVVDNGRFGVLADNESATGSWTFQNGLRVNLGLGVGAAIPSNFVNVLLTSGAGQYVMEVRQGTATANDSYGLLLTAGTSSADDAMRVREVTGLTDIFKIRGDGAVGWGTAPLTFITSSASLAPSPHDLLSGTHGDTVASAVSRGSLVVGNATPAWAELVIGAVGTMFYSDGTDAAWSATPTLTTSLTVPLIAAATTLTLQPASGSDLIITLATTGDLVVNTSLFFIDVSAAMIGIGTATPTSTLHITDAAGADLTIERTGASANSNNLIFQKSHGAGTLVLDDDSLGGVLFYGHGGVAYEIGARIEAFVDGAPGDNDMPTRLEFATTADGAATTTLAMTIDSAQLVTLANPLRVASGGTGAATFTAYSVICAGTTATGVFQNVVGVGTSGQVLTSAGAGALPTWAAAAAGGTVVNSMCDGYLTLESGVTGSVTDQSAKTTLYFTPTNGIGNRIALYSGSAWVIHTFAEISISLAGLTASTPYDAFVYDNAGTITLDLVAWTSATARATALATQDGVYVKTAATGRRYVGTIYINATGGQTDDTNEKRYVWNHYNRRRRRLRRFETTDSWTYTTNSYRQANAVAANQVDLVVGLPSVQLYLKIVGFASNASATSKQVAVGEDSVTVPLTGPDQLGMDVSAGADANFLLPVEAELTHWPAIGRHYYAWLERSGLAGTTTWWGDVGAPTTIQAGMHGWIEG